MSLAAAKRLEARLRTARLTVIVLGILGIVVWGILTASVLDSSDAYGKVQIPGTKVLHLPAETVDVSYVEFNRGSTSTGGIYVPQLSLRIERADGDGPDPDVRKASGPVSSSGNDRRIQVFEAHVANDGDYRVTASGARTAENPRLAFGHAVHVFPTLLWVGGGIVLFWASSTALIVFIRRRYLAPKPA